MPPAGLKIAIGNAAPYDNFVCLDDSHTVLDGSISWGSVAVFLKEGMRMEMAAV